MFKRLLFPVLTLLLGVGFFVWTLNSPFWRSLQQVSGVMRLVHQEYVDPEKVGYEKLAESAIQGMVESLDPYSHYMNEREYNRFRMGTELDYKGIGVEIEKLGDRVTITRVFEEGPAAEAGLRAGDQILEIEGEDMRDAGTTDVSDRLLGSGEQPVEITLYRPADEREWTVEMVRGRVKAPSIEGVNIDGDRLAYLRLTRFTANTESEFISTYRELDSSGMRGLIVDLRGNPGGLLRSAREVAGSLMEPESLVCFIEGRNRTSREEFHADGELYDEDGRVPVVVLINEMSASGSEIVAGAWQDAGVAHLVGEQTHGKGSVQSVYSFKEGDGMRQTTALYFLPSGRSINESGVDPDESVEMADEQFLNLLIQWRHASFMSSERFESQFSFEPNLEDPQLRAARQYLREVNHVPEAV